MGARFASKGNYKRLSVVTNSLLSVQILTNQPIPPWYVRNLVKKISELCNLFDNCNVVHVFREANRATDWLATRESCVGFTCFSCPLEYDFIVILEKDKAWPLYPRFN